MKRSHWQAFSLRQIAQMFRKSQKLQKKNKMQPKFNNFISTKSNILALIPSIPYIFVVSLRKNTVCLHAVVSLRKNTVK